MCHWLSYIIPGLTHLGRLLCDCELHLPLFLLFIKGNKVLPTRPKQVTIFIYFLEVASLGPLNTRDLFSSFLLILYKSKDCFFKKNHPLMKNSGPGC